MRLSLSAEDLTQTRGRTRGRIDADAALLLADRVENPLDSAPDDVRLEIDRGLLEQPPERRVADEALVTPHHPHPAHRIDDDRVQCRGRAAERDTPQQLGACRVAARENAVTVVEWELAHAGEQRRPRRRRRLFRHVIEARHEPVGASVLPGLPQLRLDLPKLFGDRDPDGRVVEEALGTPDSGDTTLDRELQRFAERGGDEGISGQRGERRRPDRKPGDDTGDFAGAGREPAQRLSS